MWSVCVIARNEEEALPRCLASVPRGVRRVVVVDDRTTDGTARWAHLAGAEVRVRRFDGWSTQRNAALDACATDRVLFLDADERLTDEVAAFLAAPDDGAAGWSFPFRTTWLGRELQGGRMGRSRHVRAVRRGRGRWVGGVHERLAVDGVVRPLDAAIAHTPYRDVWDHAARARRYAAEHDPGRRSLPGERVVRAAWHAVDALVLRAGWRDGPDGVAVAALGAASTWAKWSR